MSRYDWPRATGGKKRKDDPAKRSAFVRRRRLEFDPEGTLRVSRATGQPAHPGVVAGPFAPATGRKHLWQPLGPATILGGQAEGKPRVIGRVNALCVHDGGQRVYAASANGGVWYSRDGGANWLSVAGLASTNTAGILRPAQRNACGDIHVEFGAAEGDDLVFLGTGEVATPDPSDLGGQPGDAEGGIGILVGDKPVKSVAPDPWVREAPNLINKGVYRIAREPGGTATIAATRTGLYQRPASPGADKNWDRPTSKPFDTLNSECTDLLWTPANGGRPARLWVWVKDGPSFGLWVRATGAADFTRVTVVDAATNFDYTTGRAALAASTPATQVWVVNDRGNGTTPALFRVTNPVTGPTAPDAHCVIGVPNILRDSGWYNIAIAVDPANPNRVALAGSWLKDVTQDGDQVSYNASIVVADVAADPGNASQLTYGHPNPYTLVGIGVHPDVHALAYSNGGARLWTGCDGGVFRSDAPTRPAGFYARNNGLSISESNYIGLHPKCEGNIVAGLQDNGTVVRRSAGVWQMRFLGDGGGIAMNPVNPSQWIAQYTNGDWNVEAGGGTGPLISPTTGNLVQAESDAAAFYSMPASIAHVRGSPPAAQTNFGQTLIGTTRLWYTDDFGLSWFTLPTGTNPLPADPSVQDDVGQPITVCRWQSPDVAWVLCEQRLLRYSRTPGTHAAGKPGTWTSTRVRPPGYTATGKRKKRPPVPPAITDSKVWTDIAVNLDPPASAGQPPRQHGTLGAVYIGTIGNPDKPDVDTLWWFDGTDHWYPTNLRKSPKGGPAPVTAIVCDPAFPNEVWVGTTVGVWHGERTDHGSNPPTWEWEQRVNGLPEAAVEDLAIFSDGNLRLLRAAIASRGVWELRLDVADLQDLTYLRAHDDDLRYRARAVEKKRDLVTDRSWHGSPDVRPRVAPALVAAPASLPWERAKFPKAATEQLRRFQAALRSSTGEPRIVANGIWDAYFSEVLRDHGAPTRAVAAAPPKPALSLVRITKTFWNQHMKAPHATAEPWGASPPTEADLLELTAKLDEGDLANTSCAMPGRPLKIDIVVHHRGLDAVDGANVRVTLLRWIDPKKKNVAKWNDHTTWFAGNVGWTAAVNEVLNSADGKTSQAVDGGWKFVLGSDTQSHRLTLAGQSIDSTHAGIGTFDLDLTSVKPNAVVLLVAVIRTGTTASDDIALAPATLQDLALTSPNVAVRSLQVTP